MCEKYNGYTNYETWNVSLWIDNNEGDYDEVQSQAIEHYNNAEAGTFSTKKQSAIHQFESWLRDAYNETNPLASDSSMYSDLLQAALDSVNWYEIAENWIDQVIDDELVEVETELDLQD